MTSEAWEGSYRAAAPLAAVAGEALGGPAGAAAGGALAVGGQVALAPVVHVPRLAARAVCRVLLAVRSCEVHAFSVHVVFAYCTNGLWLVPILHSMLF